MTENTKLIKESNKKLEQSKRNVAQGLFGRTLATNKVQEIKTNMSQIVSNFQADKSMFPALVQRYSVEQHAKNNYLQNAESEVQLMQQTIDTVQKDIDGLVEVQEQLNDEGQDQLDQSLANLDKKNDPELVAIKNQLQSEVDADKKVITAFKG